MHPRLVCSNLALGLHILHVTPFILRRLPPSSHYSKERGYTFKEPPLLTDDFPVRLGCESNWSPQYVYFFSKISSPNRNLLETFPTLNLSSLFFFFGTWNAHKPSHWFTTWARSVLKNNLKLMGILENFGSNKSFYLRWPFVHDTLFSKSLQAAYNSYETPKGIPK